MCNDNNSNQIQVHLNFTGEARNSIGSLFKKDSYIAVGFGSAEILEDGRVIFDGEKQENLTTLEEAEKEIQFKDNSDYVLVLDAPLWDAKWRRNKNGEWVCFESGEGFA